jgi:hypothetical protein
MEDYLPSVQIKKKYKSYQAFKNCFYLKSKTNVLLKKLNSKLISANSRREYLITSQIRRNKRNIKEHDIKVVHHSYFSIIER